MGTAETYKEFCERLAREAGAIMRQHFRNDPETKQKADKTPVTVADEAINALVIEVVKREYPGHDVQGEEASHLENKGRHVWVCDPIDGTKPFIRGVPTSVFSLALVEDGVTVAAVVYDPWCDRLCYAEKGKGTTLNGRPVRVSDASMEVAAVGITTFSRARYDFTLVEGGLEERGGQAFNFGSTAYMGMLVACGLLDATIFPHDTAHDCAAQALLVQEAGGTATDIHGKWQRYDRPVDGFVASNGKIHDELLALLRDAGSATPRGEKHA